MFFRAKGNATISRRLRAAVKTADVRQYRLAEAIGVDNSRLSAWMCGIDTVRLNDPRIVQLGALVGVPARACFAPLASRMSRTEQPPQNVSGIRRSPRRARDRQFLVRRRRA
jgi:transcriptional regulator with XRE-family HTH domain